MPRINLLPWREEMRSKRRTQFFAALGVALVGALLVTLLGSLTMDRIIDHQKSRNALLEEEIAILDERIAEILDLENSKERLLARMQIIEELQQSRPEVVHVFDELVTTLPEGVYLTGVRQTGRRLEIEGAAESNTRVSSLMRNIDGSEWLEDPDLEVVEVKPTARGGNTIASVFTVFARQSASKAEESEE